MSKLTLDDSPLSRDIIYCDACKTQLKFNIILDRICVQPHFCEYTLPMLRCSICHQIRSITQGQITNGVFECFGCV